METLANFIWAAHLAAMRESGCKVRFPSRVIADVQRTSESLKADAAGACVVLNMAA